MRIALPLAYGGIGPSLVVRAMNDTGSAIMTLFYSEAFDMGWQPELYPPDLVEIKSPDGTTLREYIYIVAQVCDDNGSPVTGWFMEEAVLRDFTGFETRLSGAGVRDLLYFGTAPGSSCLYMARTKFQLARILPKLPSLPGLLFP
jgi:hypothetical protein